MTIVCPIFHSVGKIIHTEIFLYVPVQ